MTVPAMPPRFARADPPEVAALRRLKISHPELGPAVDMQIDLVTLYRRVQSRISTPWLEFDRDAVAAGLRAGRPVVRFEHVPFDWGEVRGLIRQIVDLCRRFDVIEQADADAVHALVRAGRPSPDDGKAWYNERGAGADLSPGQIPDALAQILPLAARPFIARAVDVARPLVNLSDWMRPTCPYCGGAPELAAIGVDGERRLLCGRCAGDWPFDEVICPHCDSRDVSRRTSFASRDGRYRLIACDACRRYVKAYIARGADRPVMLDVDTIATLPLDAVAAQNGYSA